VTEKYLREGSQAFAEARYPEAAESFRLAVVSSPAAAAPRFAFGQALIALGDYPYAARVLREAVAMEPAILNAPGSIAGVYRDVTEFDRVMAALREAVLVKKSDPDPLFLLGYQQYLSGDPQAVVSFSRLRERFGTDPALALFETALPKRFPALSQVPPAGAK
jgi:tetratricopeptide (TPR) repeat protein